MTKKKTNYKNMSYGELVTMRNELVYEIQEYEVFHNRGGHISTEFIEIPGSESEYKNNLKKLSELIEYMSDAYTKQIPMVDETSADSMLHFAYGTFWFENQEEGIDPYNAEIAMEYLDKLSDEGNADAQNMLGALYYEGIYVDKDYEKSARYYICAARNGLPLAMSNAGYCYYYGNGVEKDYEVAFKYFSKAAILGEYDAINKLGDMYRDGKYVEKDRNMAFKIYTDGYNMIPHEVKVDAYPQNLMRIGECYLYGFGCNRNDELAFKLLNEAREVFELQIDYGNIYAKKGLKRLDAIIKKEQDYQKTKVKQTNGF